ncbi:MAG: glutathione S-transferase family protein [Myxococcota bacterium]|nr:glutathione S-transferase family protein [Myxococcota bacterium]
MLLIGQFDSPFVRRVAIALHHYDLAYEHRPWSVWGQAEDIAKYNPLRRVPVLVMNDGETLIESSAILDALDDQVTDEHRLLPRSGAKRRAGLRVCALATGMADKVVSLFYERALRNDERRSRTWMDRCAVQITETLDLLEKERANVTGPYWFGGLSHADIAVTCAMRFLGEADPELSRQRSRPALAAHAEYCEAMPLFQSAVQAFHVAL